MRLQGGATEANPATFMPELCQNTDEKDEINEAKGIYIRNKRAIRKQKYRKTSQYAEAKEWHSRGQRFVPAYLHQKPSKFSDFDGFSYFAEQICGILTHFTELPDTYLTTDWTI